jgi:hypothetical protein
MRQRTDDKLSDQILTITAGKGGKCRLLDQQERYRVGNHTGASAI